MKSERSDQIPAPVNSNRSADPHIHAAELIALYGSKAQQHAIDLIQAAVRRNDDLTELLPVWWTPR